MSQATLTTSRLILRPIRLSDAPAIQRHFGRWEIIQNLSLDVPWPYPEDGAAVFIETVLLPAMASGDKLVWAITRKQDPQEAIGLLEFRCDAQATDHRGFWLAVEHQGQGYMTEAVIAFQDHAFFDLGIEHMYVHNARANHRSRRIKEKTGAQFVSEVQLAHHCGNTDSERWIVTREHWAEVRGRAVDGTDNPD